MILLDRVWQLNNLEYKTSHLLSLLTLLTLDFSTRGLGYSVPPLKINILFPILLNNKMLFFSREGIPLVITPKFNDRKKKKTWYEALQHNVLHFEKQFPSNECGSRERDSKTFQSE